MESRMRLSIRNFLVILFVGFATFVEWAVVLTSLFPYIEKYARGSIDVTVYFSLTQSIFPLGQAVSQPVASLLVKRFNQIRLVLVGTLIIAIAGNVVYMMAEWTEVVELICLGRAIAGFGSGSHGVAFGFIGANTSKESRTSYMALYRVVCMLGVLFATIASATILPNFEDNALGKLTGLTEFTSPAALTIAYLAISLVLVMFVLDESDCSPIGDQGDTSSFKSSLKSRGVLLSIILFFMNGYVTTWASYVMPLVVYPIFKWNVDQFGWLMVGVSVATAVGSFATTFLSKSECMKTKGDWIVLTVCYVFMVAGMVLSYVGGPSILKSFSTLEKEVFLITGMIVVFLTYAVSGVILPSMATKFVPKAMMPVILPYCIASMSMGKVVAPLLSEAMQQIQGWDFLFIGPTVLVALSFILFLWLYKNPVEEEETILPEQRKFTAIYKSVESSQSGQDDD